MGTVSVPQLTDNTTHTAAQHNNQINAVANEFNGGIDNNNIKAGAAIDGTKMASNTTIALKPVIAYKFSVYRNAAASTGNAAFAAIAFDTELFDTGSNVLAGVFTAPVTGFYQFNWMIQIVAAGVNEQLVASLFVNGVRTLDGADPKAYGAIDIASSGGGLVPLTAGQTVDIRAFDSAAARAINVGNVYVNYFTGYLVSV